MKQYIETKIINAEQMNRGECKNMTFGLAIETLKKRRVCCSQRLERKEYVSFLGTWGRYPEMCRHS